MTLRNKVLLIFLSGFIIFCGVYALEFILSNKLSQNRIFKAVIMGQTSTWRKVRESAYERMLFYAYDAKPGQPSVWRLRGRRSPIEAILSGNTKKIRRAIVPLYKNLKKDNILDIIWIFDHQNKPLLIANGPSTLQKTKNFMSPSIKELVVETNKQKRAQRQFVIVNQEIYATVSFPIFSNARVAGTVVYGRKIDPLIRDLAANTKSEIFVFHSVDGLIFGTKPNFSDLAKDRFKSENYAILESGENIFLANSLSFKIREDDVQLVFLLDVSKEYKKQQLYYFITIGLILLVAASLIIGTNYLLKRGFAPLNKAIDVLNALSDGDTSVDIEVKGKDEVGRIAATVSSFRKSLIEREKVRSLFGKYIPEAVAEKLLKGDGALQPQVAEATIFFVDLADFTSMSEKLEPEGIVELLNEYFSAIVLVIEKHNGVITQFQGDAILAIFNVPIPDNKHALNAIHTAIDMIDLVSKNKFCGQQLSCRIGITTGNVVAGNVGAKDRLNYTVHGDIVNLAARLEQLNKEYSTNILVDEATVRLVYDIDFKEIGHIPVRGKDEEVSVYTLS
jgi:class 3 adenylate cyclase